MGESGQPYLDPDSSGNGLSFSPINFMLAVSLQYVAFIVFMYASCIFAYSNIFITRHAGFCQTICFGI